MLLPTLVTVLSLVGLSFASPMGKLGIESGPCASCFPALDFRMPRFTPETTADWWCDMSSEYAFVGISYEVTSC